MRPISTTDLIAPAEVWGAGGVQKVGLVVGAESSHVDSVAWRAADPADSGGPWAVVFAMSNIAAQIAGRDGFLGRVQMSVRAEVEAEILGDSDGGGGGRCTLLRRRRWGR